MRAYLLASTVIGILIGFGIGYSFFAYVEQSIKQNTQVGIYYYAWYNSSDDGYSWIRPKIRDAPLIGNYSNCNVNTAVQHLAWLSDLSVDFAIVSWWSHYNQTPWNSFVNSATHQTFRIAEHTATVKFCVMVEGFNSPPFNKTGKITYDYSEIYNYVYENFVSSYPSVYYQYENKPLLCFFNDQYLTGNNTIPADIRFTSIIVGTESYANWVYTDLVPIEGPVPRNRQISVTPRFDNSGMNGSTLIDATLTNRTYDKQWEKAISLAKQDAIDVITICSWNEYPERTAIEPHIDPDAYDKNPYFLYNKTRQYISMLKGNTG